MFVESCSHSEFVSAPMPMVAMASPAVDVPHPPHPHPRGHQHKGQRLQTKLAPQGPGGAPSFELVISRALRLWKKREGKALVLQGLCGVTPQLSPRCWHCPPSQSRGQLGKKLGGSGGWQKINHSSWVLSLSAPTGFHKQNFTVHWQEQINWVGRDRKSQGIRNIYLDTL